MQTQKGSTITVERALKLLTNQNENTTTYNDNTHSSKTKTHKGISIDKYNSKLTGLTESFLLCSTCIFVTLLVVGMIVSFLLGDPVLLYVGVTWLLVTTLVIFIQVNKWLNLLEETVGTINNRLKGHLRKINIRVYIDLLVSIGVLFICSSFELTHKYTIILTIMINVLGWLRTLYYTNKLKCLYVDKEDEYPFITTTSKQDKPVSDSNQYILRKQVTNVGTAFILTADEEESFMAILENMQANKGNLRYNKIENYYLLALQDIFTSMLALQDNKDLVALQEGQDLLIELNETKADILTKIEQELKEIALEQLSSYTEQHELTKAFVDKAN